MPAEVVVIVAVLVAIPSLWVVWHERRIQRRLRREEIERDGYDRGGYDG